MPGKIQKEPQKNEEKSGRGGSGPDRNCSMNFVQTHAYGGPEVQNLRFEIKIALAFFRKILYTVFCYYKIYGTLVRLANQRFGHRTSLCAQ